MTLTRSTPVRSGMQDAYLEYRKACYVVLARHAERREVFNALQEPTTATELAKKLRVIPQRGETLILFLKALTRLGLLDVQSGDHSPQYWVANGVSVDDVPLDTGLIARAIGADKVEQLIYGQSYAGIVDTLQSEENPIAADFVSKHSDLWNEFLNQPFYKYARQGAATTISFPGARVIDLANGPGFGLRELHDQVGSDGMVCGIEVSSDFVAEATRRTADLPNIHCGSGDLDHGFSHLRDGFFDGAMIIGAYHFLKKKSDLFANVNRILKPGGRFCVGYTFMKRGTFDQELMDLRFHLRQPPSAPITEAQLLHDGTRHGFTLISEEYSLGCFGWYSFEKVA